MAHDMTFGSREQLGRRLVPAVILAGKTVAVRRDGAGGEMRRRHHIAVRDRVA